jgi:hypothetical protein
MLQRPAVLQGSKQYDQEPRGGRRTIDRERRAGGRRLASRRRPDYFGLFLFCLSGLSAWTGTRALNWARK